MHARKILDDQMLIPGRSKNTGLACLQHPCRPSLSRLLLLPRDKGLAVARADAHVGKNLFGTQLDGNHVGRLIGYLLLELLGGRQSGARGVGETRGRLTMLS